MSVALDITLKVSIPLVVTSYSQGMKQFILSSWLPCTPICEFSLHMIYHLLTENHVDDIEVKNIIFGLCITISFMIFKKSLIYLDSLQWSNT